MTDAPQCSRCNDEGRVTRKLVVGMQGGEPVTMDGWLPCGCSAGEEVGAPCTICHGVGSILVELSHSPTPGTAATLHPCEHCGGSGEEPLEPLLQTVLRFFEDDGWDVSLQADNPIIWMSFQGANDEWKCCLQIREEEQQILYYSICPRRVDPKDRANMAEFITRANYGMVIGNFEMDYSDGEVRFKTSVDVEDANLTRALLHHIVHANLLMTDKYLPGITAIVEGQGPRAAIEMVEGQPN
jgi:hypothetical protein